jgi:hypothetical protein
VWIRPAPDHACQVTITVSVPDAAHLADDDIDAEDEVEVSVIKPQVSRISFSDYGMAENAEVEDEEHNWECEGWGVGDAVEAPQWENGPLAPAYFIGGQICTADVHLDATGTLTEEAAIDVRGDWENWSGSGTVQHWWGEEEIECTSEQFEQRVDKYVDQAIQWSYRCPDGSNNWIDTNASDHDVLYQSYAAPLHDADATKKRTDAVCTEAEDLSTPETIADPIFDWLVDALPDGQGGIQTEPWCYLDAGADNIECDDQAYVMKLAIELLGVPGEVVYVRATPTDDPDCLDLPPAVYCEVHQVRERLWLKSGGGAWQVFEAACRVEGINGIDDALWDEVRGKTDQNHRGDLKVLRGLHKDWNWTQKWRFIGSGQDAGHDPVPPPGGPLE